MSSQPSTPVSGNTAGGGAYISAAALLWGLQFAFLNPSIGLLLAELYGATAAEVGWALAAYNISGFVSTLIVPAWADQRGDYLRPMLWCGVLTVALVTCLALATTLPLAVLALVALGGPAGVGIGLLFAHQQSTGASVREVMRTRAVFSFAWVAGPPLATLLLGLLGRRSVLWAIAILAVVCILVTIGLRRLVSANRSAVADDSGETSSADDIKVLTVLRSRKVLLLVLGFVLLAAANNAAVSVITLFVTTRLGLEVVWGGIALGVAAGLEIPFILLMGRMVGRFSAMWLVVVGSLAAAAYYLSMVFVTGPVTLIAVQLLNAIGIAATLGVGLTVIQDVVPRPGLASGLYMNTTRVGAVLAGPVIATGGAAGLGYAMVFFVAGVLALVGVGLLAASVWLGRHVPAPTPATG